jgi:hypothetical protein
MKSVHTLSVAFVIQFLQLADKSIYTSKRCMTVSNKLNFLAHPGCSGFTAGIAGSNPVERVDIRLLCLLYAV